MKTDEKERLIAQISKYNAFADRLCDEIAERQFMASFMASASAYLIAALNADVEGARIRNGEKYYDDEGYLRPIWECLDAEFLQYLANLAKKAEGNVRNGQTAN